MPKSRQARIIRTAISPRLAIISFLNIDRCQVTGRENYTRIGYLYYYRIAGLVGGIANGDVGAGKVPGLMLPLFLAEQLRRFVFDAVYFVTEVDLSDRAGFVVSSVDDDPVGNAPALKQSCTPLKLRISLLPAEPV